MEKKTYLKPSILTTKGTKQIVAPARSGMGQCKVTFAKK